MLFVIAYRKLDLAEYILYSAFKADFDSIFYQREDSEDWKLLNSILTEVDLKNPKRYMKDIQTTINNIFLGGAMVSQSMKSNNAFNRFFRSLGYSTYYMVSMKNRKN